MDKNDKKKFDKPMIDLSLVIEDNDIIKTPKAPITKNYLPFPRIKSDDLIFSNYLHRE